MICRKCRNVVVSYTGIIGGKRNRGFEGRVRQTARASEDVVLRNPKSTTKDQTPHRSGPNCSRPDFSVSVSPVVITNGRCRQVPGRVRVIVVVS